MYPGFRWSVAAFPAVIGVEGGGTPWTDHQSVTRQHSGKQPHTHPLTAMVNVESHQLNMHVFVMWEKTGGPGESPHRQMEEHETSHRRDLNQNPLAVRQQSCHDLYPFV